MDLSSKIEDYLEAMFAVEVSGKEATVTGIAKMMNVSKPTVVAAVRRLAGDELVVHERYGAIHLTEEGRERALQIYRRHEHLTFLLHDILGIDAERAWNMACAMEHEMDEKAETRLLGFVDYLVTARRNNEPWVRELLSTMGDERGLPRPLTMTPKEKPGIIARITSGEETKKRLNAMGFRKGREAMRLSDAAVDASVAIRVAGRDVRIQAVDAASVWLCMSPDMSC